MTFNNLISSARDFNVQGFLYMVDGFNVDTLNVYEWNTVVGGFTIPIAGYLDCSTLPYHLARFSPDYNTIIGSRYASPAYLEHLHFSMTFGNRVIGSTTTSSAGYPALQVWNHITWNCQTVLIALEPYRSNKVR